MTESVTYSVAVAMVASAVRAAEEQGIAIAVVVLDSAGDAVATGKMDGAIRSTPVVAPKKAFTALNFGAPSATMAERVQPPAYQAVVTAADPRLTFMGGGVPIKDGAGRTIGAIGVAGGTTDQDVSCCDAALDAVP